MSAVCSKSRLVKISSELPLLSDLLELSFIFVFVTLVSASDDCALELDADDCEPPVEHAVNDAVMIAAIINTISFFFIIKSSVLLFL